MRLTKQLDKAAGEIAETVVGGLFDTVINVFEWIDTKWWRKVLAAAALMIFCTCQYLDYQTFRSQQAIRQAYHLAWIDRIERHIKH